MIKTRYLCSIAYDGSSYSGLVKQPSEVTILDQMEKAFMNSFNENISIVPAGRTDAGVHARNQMIEFCSIIPQNKIIKWWNNSLPKSIKVNTCKEVKEKNFHVRFSVVEKKYTYCLSTKEKNPFEARYKHFISSSIDITKMKEVLSLFIGERDFSAVAKVEDGQNPIRSIRKIDVREDNGTIYISFYGKSFLRYMVRRIVGTALAVSQGIETLDSVQNKMKEKATLKHSVPGCGLFLEMISYKEVIK